MAGELWNQQFEIGKETTPNTTVAATRQMYFRPDDSRLSRERQGRAHKFATGDRSPVRAFTLGPTQVSGQLSMPMSASEIIEFLLMTIKGAVTPTGAGSAKLWTFTPGTSLESATVRWHDGARPWRAGGVRGNKLKIAGSVKDENIVTCEVMGMSMTQTALTGSLAARVPDFIEGWESKLYIDAYAATPGTTVIANELIAWDIEIDNGLKRKYWADNTNDAGAIVPDAIEVKAKLTFEAAASQALTEYNNWDAATKRLVRCEFGQNEVISGADKKFVTVDIPGAWDMVDLGGTDEGTRTYELGLQYVYDTTNTFGLQIRAQNARTAAW